MRKLSALALVLSLAGVACGGGPGTGSANDINYTQHPNCKDSKTDNVHKSSGFAQVAVKGRTKCTKAFDKIRVVTTIFSDHRGQETKDSGWKSNASVVEARAQCRCAYVSDSDYYWGWSRHYVVDNGVTWDWYSPKTARVYIPCP